MSESSESSECGPNLTEGVPELDVEPTDLVPNRLNVTQIIKPPEAGSIAAATPPATPSDGKEYYLYDKYLAK